MTQLDRRKFLTRALTGAAALTLAGCDRLSRTEWFTRMLGTATNVNQHVQSFVTPAGAKGRQYTRADISPYFRSNGTHYPRDPDYLALARNGFADWRLELGGLVDHPAALSLGQLRALPSVTQITRHDCVEGWSCIGEWTGVPLASVLAPLGVRKAARYVVFFCYDTVASVGSVSERYYESIDLAEAHHPETILAYAMNGQTLPIPHGAPLRLRLGRQLGYKMPKYLRRIELVDSFAQIEGGHGGLYEDNGYAWYAGI